MTYFPGRIPNYDRRPSVPVGGQAWAGWDACGAELQDALDVLGALGAPRRGSGAGVVLVVELHPDVAPAEVESALERVLLPGLTVRTSDLLRTPAEVESLVAPWLGDDPVFGRMAPLTIADYLDPVALAAARRTVEDATGVAGLVLVVGPGASLVHPGDLLVYADLARWEAQQRQRRGELGNLGAHNAGARPAELYKRAYFVDWRAANRMRCSLWGRIDFLLDCNLPANPRMTGGDTVRAGLHSVTRRPFRLVPFFDPAPWGGQWMREVCDLDPGPANFGWCFDCVPEENSLVLDVSGVDVELPAVDLVNAEPQALLGDPVHARFGAEFPIRFDFLDTMGGGNLSLQVHPLTEYIQEQFGMHYTQDESYYLLHAEPGAHVYLGLREGVEPTDFEAALRRAQAGGEPLDADAFAGRYPARPHDHFLIPAGTLHCSGAGAMVLEISATPYIFTFKQWDWGRLGLDGRPRPVHIDHGMRNIQWDRQEPWVRRNLVDRVEPLDSGPEWRRERTGLHEREFIETVRTWFTGPYPADTGGMASGGVHVLNLVAGDDAVVTSPTGAFPPFDVHYAETWIVPAAVGEYAVAPGPRAAAEGGECATITAFVRTRP